MKRRRVIAGVVVLAGGIVGAVGVWSAVSPDRPVPPFVHTRHEGERFDPIEDDPHLQPVLEAAGHEAEAELAAHGIRNGFGFCNYYWPVKKRILKDKYGVDWRTPPEMNPGVIWD
jgi:hypothetical protein